MVNPNDRLTRGQFLSVLGSFLLTVASGCDPAGTGSVTLDPSIKSKRKFSKDKPDVEVLEGKPKRGRRK